MNNKIPLHNSDAGRLSMPAMERVLNGAFMIVSPIRFPGNRFVSSLRLNAYCGQIDRRAPLRLSTPVHQSCIESERIEQRSSKHPQLHSSAEEASQWAPEKKDPGAWKIEIQNGRNPFHWLHGSRDAQKRWSG